VGGEILYTDGQTDMKKLILIPRHCLWKRLTRYDGVNLDKVRWLMRRHGFLTKVAHAFLRVGNARSIGCTVNKLDWQRRWPDSKRWWRPQGRSIRPTIWTANQPTSITHTHALFVSSYRHWPAMRVQVLGCDAASLVKRFPSFRNTVVKQSTNNSTWTTWTWR
jgi:hypothetical protein